MRGQDRRRGGIGLRRPRCRQGDPWIVRELADIRCRGRGVSAVVIPVISMVLVDMQPPGDEAQHREPRNEFSASAEYERHEWWRSVIRPHETPGV